MTCRWPLVLAAALTVSCRSAGPTVPKAVPTAPTGGATMPPAVAHEPAERPIPGAVRWARDSAEHRALFLEVYRAATAHVEQEGARRAPGTWAVILDADETTIDNSGYQRERALAGRGFEAESWREWCARREAVPLPGAAAFLDRVRALGGRIAIVTNRNADECPDTEAVFQAHGLAYDVMLCKPVGGPSDKNTRFEAVARGTTPAGLPPLDVVAFVGDNIQDFPGLGQAIREESDDAFAAFGERYFLLPNPMYGSWERN
jgi:5'-nucleotidase (lipoprotein e(P4) family)